MSLWTIVLVGIGLISIAVSLANSKHPPTNTDLMAVSRSMSDESIRKTLKTRRWRVDAKLGVQYGIAFICLGLLWQAFLSVYWF